MPSERFLNLPQPKQERIVGAALTEFATKGYEAASIAQMVRQAQIPRGSFYQYFQGKRDLFAYILEHIAQAKLQYLDLGSVGKVPFLDFFRSAYHSGVRFAQEHPEYLAIGLCLQASAHPDMLALREHFRNQGIQAIQTLIESAKAGGQLRDDVDAYALALILSSITSEVSLEQMIQSEDLIEKVMAILERGVLKEG